MGEFLERMLSIGFFDCLTSAKYRDTHQKSTRDKLCTRDAQLRTRVTAMC